MSTVADNEIIYLDRNATTPIAPELLEAMLPYLRTAYGNPSSDHPIGRAARRAVEEAREQVADLLGAGTDEIVFTSGGTQSNNLAIFGTASTAPAGRRRIVTSSVEHPATASPCGRLEANGWVATRVPVTPAGLLDAPAATSALSGDVALCTMLLAQNETGALYVRRSTPLSPVLVGADQERELRPGTENVAGILGLGAACELSRTWLAFEPARLRALRDGLLAELSAGVPGLVCHTSIDASLPNTLFVSFPGVRGTDLLARASGIAASTGSACHASEATPSATLAAMGVAPGVAPGVARSAVRLSLGRDTTGASVALAVDRLVAAWRQARDEHSVPETSKREE